jgi:hypothetical protein
MQSYKINVKYTEGVISYISPEDQKFMKISEKMEILIISGCHHCSVWWSYCYTCEVFVKIQFSELMYV